MSVPTSSFHQHGGYIASTEHACRSPQQTRKRLFSSNDGAKNNWQQPVNPNVPPDIDHPAKGSQNSSLNIPTMVHTAVDTHPFVAHISAATQQPHFGDFQHMMALDAPSLGQFRLPQNYPVLGNFPGQYFHHAGMYVASGCSSQH